MKSFEQFLKAILNALDDAGIEYLIGGAVAVWPWGEPRSTLDVDLVVRLTPESVVPLSQALEKIEIFLPTEIILENLLETRADLPINAIHGSSGFKAELFPIRQGDDLRTSAFARRRLVDFGGEIGAVYVHAPEDLIVYKLIYFSLSRQTKHIRDIGSILKVYQDKLDRPYLEAWINKKGLGAFWEEILSAL